MRRRAGSAGIWAGLEAALLFAASLGGQQPQPPHLPPHPVYLPEANRTPDANDRIVMREQHDRQKKCEALNKQRKRLMGKQSAQLLRLAVELKAAADNDGAPPALLMAKAAEIERLAREVKETMQLAPVGN
ncbi:MAG: hypothetical protein WCE75_15825 [Terracidiphilus sp.]